MFFLPIQILSSQQTSLHSSTTGKDHSMIISIIVFQLLLFCSRAEQALGPAQGNSWQCCITAAPTNNTVTPGLKLHVWLPASTRSYDWHVQLQHSVLLVAIQISSLCLFKTLTSKFVTVSIGQHAETQNDWNQLAGKHELECPKQVQVEASSSSSCLVGLSAAAADVPLPRLLELSC